MIADNSLRCRLERRTGTVFGFHRRSSLAPYMPPGTFYVRVGKGPNNLCAFEAGNRHGFFYFDRMR